MTTLESSASFGVSAPHKRSQHSTLPASPTLTNPDMILPDYDRSSSPFGLGEPMQSVWGPSQASKQNTIYGAQPHQYNAYTTPHATVSVTTPIIYGNGTMLSDIGEVTEAESTPGRPSPPRKRYGGPIATSTPAAGVKVEDSEGDAALRSSPTIGKSGALGGVKKRAKTAQRERRDSTDSNSTITGGQEQTPKMAVPEDFDDTVSVGDSVFQGDDEESMASSYADDAASLASGPLLPSELNNNRNNGQKYSTAQLSRRAEQILANAKKRLTHMEDNLSKARSSLLVATNHSDSNPSSPSPPVARASTSLMMSTTGQMSPITGHFRSGSDNSLRIGIPIKVYPQRSSSVLGISTGPRHPGLTVSRSADQLNGQFNRQRASYMVTRELEPLGEDDVSQTQRRSELFNLNKYSPITSPTFGTPSEKGLSRSASTSHMREIRDQVNDLKGKISSLREQARADSLKRRSLQNLRTPSPFTNAKLNQWHAKSVEDGELTPPIEEDPGVSSWSDDTASGDIARDGGSGAFNDGAFDVAATDSEGLEAENMDRSEQFTPDPFEYEIGPSAEDDNEDLLTENGDAEEDGDLIEPEYEEATGDDDDLMSDSDDSIYHESVQHHISHEDREDAFDYEHFFLHSAMGTISQALARRRSDASFTSEDSVETTRGPVAETEHTDQEKPPSLTRVGSDRSISTMESFATATEGLSSRQSSRDELRPRQDGTDEEELDETADVVGPETFPILQTHSDAFERPETPPTAKRSTFGAGALSSPSGQGSTRLDSLYSSIRRPMSSTAMTRPHAPSVSSFESTGTTRSFPLVNRPASKSSGSSGVLTPEGRSSESDGRTTSSVLFSGRTSQAKGASNGQHTHQHSLSLRSTSSSTSLIEENGTTAVMETLPRDDQFLVERLVASLGRCVLGLTENSRASTEARMYRRRIDAARRILEGLDQV